MSDGRNGEIAGLLVNRIGQNQAGAVPLKDRPHKIAVMNRSYVQSFFLRGIHPQPDTWIVEPYSIGNQQE